MNQNKFFLFAIFALSLFFLQTAIAQESSEAHDKRMQWWREARKLASEGWDNPVPSIN